MAASLRKMGVFFGLTEDDTYEDSYADDSYGSRGATALRQPAAEESARPVRLRQEQGRAVEPVREWDHSDSKGDSHSNDGSRGESYAADYTEYVDYPAEQPAYRITTLHPRTYNEAVTIGEHFRSGTPVIMNLSEMADTDAKRLVDFAAGLTFGLHGRVERVTSKVFLLSPQNVTVTAQDKARIAENGFFNQS